MLLYHPVRLSQSTHANRRTRWDESNLGDFHVGPREDELADMRVEGEPVHALPLDSNHQFTAGAVSTTGREA